MVKKVFSLIMAVFLLFSLSAAAYSKGGSTLAEQGLTQAKTKINYESAVNIAKKALKDCLNFELDEKQYQNNNQLSPIYDSKDSYRWDLGWYSYNGSVNKSINVGIDANTGKILSINKNDSRNNQTVLPLPKYSKDEAKKEVEAFLQKIAPEDFKNTSYTDIQSYRTYSSLTPYYEFRYARTVNGIEYSNNFLYVVYDGVNGAITSYSNQWDDSLTFPDKGKVINASLASENFSKMLQMKLQYIPYYDSSNPSEFYKDVVLVYAPYYEISPMVDAYTGEPYKYNNDNQPEKIDLNSQDKETFLKSYKEISKLEKEIDKDKAEEIANAALKKLMAGDITITNMSYQQNNLNGTTSDPIWVGQFNINTSNLYGSITIDAVTGQLKTFYEYRPMSFDEKFTPKLTQKEAYTKAIELIKEFYPDKVKDIITEQTLYNGKNMINGKLVENQYYNFSFSRKVNDIPFNNNSIQIGFDAATGMANNLYFNWSDNIKFQEPKNIISSDDAKKKYWDNCKLTLNYVPYSKISGDTTEIEIKLAYTNTSDRYNIYGSLAYVDALAGKLLNYSGEDISNLRNDIFASKIKGSKYESELAMLSVSGVIDTNNFDADKNVSKLDIIKALVMLKGNRYSMSQPPPELKFTDIQKDSSDYLTIQKAVTYGIVKNESTAVNPDQLLTREEVIKYLIDMTPFGTLANSTDIFKLNYSDVNDISSDKFGYIALAKGLKILNDDSNKLEPKSNIKMDELYHYIYNTANYVTMN